MLFVVDAGFSSGLGHLVRSLALAERLKRDFGVRACFLIVGDRRLIRRVKNAGFPCEAAGTRQLHGSIRRMVSKGGCRTVIFDRKKGAPDSRERAACQNAKTVAFVNALNSSDEIGRTDLAFVQGLPSPEPKAPNCRFGLRWVVLRPFPQSRRRPASMEIFVAAGGSDPQDATAMACRALKTCSAVKRIHIILGAYYRGSAERLNLGPRFKFHRDVRRPDSIMARCRMGVVSYGMTALESLALGVPVVAISLTPDHLASARLIERRHKCLRSAGLVKRISGKRLKEEIDRFIGDRRRLAAMSRSARLAVDGRGAERVCRTIIKEASNAS